LSWGSTPASMWDHYEGSGTDPSTAQPLLAVELVVVRSSRDA